MKRLFTTIKVDILNSHNGKDDDVADVDMSSSTPATSPSKNDLFMVDWSPTSPNISTKSRRNTVTEGASVKAASPDASEPGPGCWLSPWPAARAAAVEDAGALPITREFYGVAGRTGSETDGEGKHGVTSDDDIARNAMSPESGVSLHRGPVTDNPPSDSHLPYTHHARASHTMGGSGSGSGTGTDLGSRSASGSASATRHPAAALPRSHGASYGALGLGTNPNFSAASRRVDVNLNPERKYIMGMGRYATVYLSAFRRRDSNTLQLCTAKRALADRESQVAGMSEAYVLSKLAGHPHILTLYGIKDELEGALGETTGDAPGETGVLSSTRDADGVSDAAHQGHAPIPSSDLGLGHLGKLDLVGDAGTDHLPVPKPPLISISSHSSYQAEGGTGLSETKLTSHIAERSVSAIAPNTSSHLEPRGGMPEPAQVLHSASLGVDSNPHHHGRIFSEPERNLALLAKLDNTNLKRHFSLNERPPQNLKKRDGGEHTPRIILLLELCPYGSSLMFIRLFPEQMGRTRWLEWAQQLASAVAFCHRRGVLHADIKPQNVLVAGDKTIRLADFGMSQLLSSRPIDPIGLGTVQYSAPECVQPHAPTFTAASDIYSLGVTLAVWISGVEPFEGVRGAVEKMVQVKRGGYWDWNERRRMSEIGVASDASRGLTRNGSLHYSSPGRPLTSGSNRGGDGFLDALEEHRQWIAHLPELAHSIVGYDVALFADTPPHTAQQQTVSYARYPDGLPLQRFLDEDDVVNSSIRDLIRAMLDVNPLQRPTAEQVVGALRQIERSEMS